MNARESSISGYSSHIVFITGGTKSGKSEFAEHLEKEVKKLSYVALSENNLDDNCLLYTSPSPRDFVRSRMPSSA